MGAPNEPLGGSLSVTGVTGSGGLVLSARPGGGLDALAAAAACACACCKAKSWRESRPFQELE